MPNTQLKFCNCLSSRPVWYFGYFLLPRFMGEPCPFRQSNTVDIIWTARSALLMHIFIFAFSWPSQGLLFSLSDPWTCFPPSVPLTRNPLPFLQPPITSSLITSPAALFSNNGSASSSLRPNCKPIQKVKWLLCLPTGVRNLKRSTQKVLCVFWNNIARASELHNARWCG